MVNCVEPRNSFMKNLTNLVYFITISMNAADGEQPVYEKVSLRSNIHEIRKFPHHASILFNSEVVCSGAIIDEKHILTAAYCVDRGAPSNILVRVGSDYTLSGGDVYRVCSIKIHELYNWSTQDNDIAIVQLCRRLRLTEFVKAITAEKKRKFIRPGTPATLSGVDRDNKSDSKGIVQSEASIIQHKRCIKMYRNLLNVTDNMICAESSEEYGPCQEDFGGPMVINDELVGILSWRNGCLKDNLPAVFTRIVNYYEWIHENTESI